MTNISRTRTVRILLAFAAVCTGLLLFDAGPAAASVPPDPGGSWSSLGGTITRFEVLYRAQNWYDHRGDASLTYDDPDVSSVLPFHWDFNETRKYRRDCSGYVDMAWHLNADNYTGTLANVANKLGSKSQLLPGDILLDAGVHVLIFKEWVVQGSSFRYYSFGDTPIVLGTETLTGGSDAKIDSHPAADYVPYRYKKITG